MVRVASPEEEVEYSFVSFTRLCVAQLMLLSTIAEAIGPDTVVGDKVRQLTRGTQWRQVSAVKVDFDAQHPQGMVKIGDRLSGLQVPRPARNAVLRSQQLSDEEGRPAVSARRNRDRRPADRPGGCANAD